MFRDLIGKGVEICNINLQQGYIKEDGSVSTSGDTDHSKYVTTGFIEGGRDFLCYLNEHYFVNSVSVYDQEGNLLCQNMFTVSARRYKMMQEFSFHLHKYYRVRLTIVRNDTETLGYNTVSYIIQPERDITPDEDIINQFFYLDLQYFDKLGTDDPGYEDAQLRKEHICSMWTDRGSLPCKHSADQGPTNEFGVLYSDQNETPGRVGLEVSPWTYVTACHNPRSVLHTELVHNTSESPVHQSEYGFNYLTTNTARCWSWHGANCSNTVCYVLGFDELPVARNFLTGGGYNTTEITPENDCSNLHIFDMIVSTSHIWVITNIFKDAKGDVRFIETTESGGGTLTTAITMYSPEGFLSRVRNEQSGEGYHIQRLPGYIPNKAPVTEFDYMPNNLTNDFIPVTLNNDICTFIGDKTSFMWGNIIYLNAQRQRGWENIEIEKWNSTNEQYEHFQTIDISAGDTYPTKDTDGDWIDVNISSYYPYKGTEYGKYRAYCTGVNGYNIWDKNKDWLVTPNNYMFWLDPNNNVIKKNSTAGNETHLFAYECKPNTTYIATIPSTTYYESSLLRLGWTSGDLSFVDNYTAPVALGGSAQSTVLADNKVVTTITTGSTATYLFVYIADPADKAQKAINTMTLKEQTGVDIESEPTYYEVLATGAEATLCNGVSTYNFKDFYGTTTYFCYENSSGFCNNNLSPTYRFQHPSDASRLSHAGSSWVALPSSSHIYFATRTRGEYGVAKKREQYSTPTNYYSSTYWVASKNIDVSTGELKDDNYRNVVVVDGVSEGEVYYFMMKRVLSAAYNNERYAFYDSNDQMVGDIQWLYNPNDPVYIDPPAIGDLRRWTIVVPAGVTKIKIAILTGNTNQQVWKPNTYYPPETA